MKMYVKDRIRGFIFGAVTLAGINFYLGILCASSLYWEDLIYMDAILLAGTLFYIVLDYLKWKKIPHIPDREIEKNREGIERLLGRQVTRMLCEMEAENKEEITALIESREVLTDYITRWVHEVKLPLSALRLMNERNPDEKLQMQMQDCLERMQQLLNTMMMSSKLKNMENDIRYEKVYLEEAVNEALKNQSYFLIQEHFIIEKKLGDIFTYSDKRWLVYILDQLIGNAIKYRQESPELIFRAKQVTHDEVVLEVQDNGIGMKEEEIPYIFDRGYIGSNLRNGDYRSTGMGLYFVKETARHLGIHIQVWARPERGSRFELHFYSNAEYLNL